MLNFLTRTTGRLVIAVRLLEVRFAAFSSGSWLSQMMTWRWCDPRGAAALGKKPSKIMTLLQWFEMLRGAQTQCHLARATQYCLHALVSLWNYAALDCYFLFMSLFLTQEQIVRVCCRLATLGELEDFSSKLRAVSIGFRGLFCITLPEEKSKQALFFFFFTSIECSSSPECQFIQTPDLLCFHSRAYTLC